MKIALVACAKQKLPVSARARDLYTSDLFTKSRDLVEASGYDTWYILSAKWGMLDPKCWVGPYDESLQAMTAQERALWGRRVCGHMSQTLSENFGAAHTVDIYAGELYRQDLVPWLQYHHVTVNIPMAGLGIGEQKAWLKSKISEFQKSKT